MKRRRYFSDVDEDIEHPRPRPARLLVQDNDEDERAGGTSAPQAVDLPEALLNLCSRFGLEPWAASRDDRGLWAFGCALAQWLERCRTEPPNPSERQLEAIRLLTNLLIILGAVVRPSGERSSDSGQQAVMAVAAARRSIGSRLGPVPSFPGTARAMQRLIRVRGWVRLTPAQQALAEALLSLYLELLAATITEPSPEPILCASEAWLTLLHVQALPAGFDERLLRATSWYLETYTAACAAR